MPKISVYVPNELHEQMEGVATNWSAVAQRAFEHELIRIRAMNDEDVVERLRASRDECHDDDEERGKLVGAKWARQAASWRELKRLEKYHQIVSRENVALDFYSFAKNVFSSEDDNEIREFAEWLEDEGEGDGDESSPEFIEGFMLGALEVWEEVETKL